MSIFAAQLKDQGTQLSNTLFNMRYKTDIKEGNNLSWCSIGFKEASPILGIRKKALLRKFVFVREKFVIKAKLN